jgi:hypothetical protein
MTNLPLLKGISSPRFGRFCEEIWDFCLQFFFSFPRSFFFYVVAPSNLAHMNFVVPRDLSDVSRIFMGCASYARFL